MNKTLIISSLSIVIILLLSQPTINAQDLDAVNHQITITTQDNKNLKIIESIILQLNTNESLYTIDFWIQNGANNVDIFVNEIEYTYIKDVTKYSINISTLGLKIGDQINAEISYILDKNTQNFEKKLFQNTDSILVKYDNKILYSSLDNNIGAQLIIPIYKTVEPIKESPYIYYIIITILIIVIIVIFIYNIRLRKIPKTKEIISTTEEVLTTKKSLLMSLLKDLEKQYRAKEISDDTYHKIKEQYKQETVETMKKLDDISKSKVK
jgi:hypothetical protein